MLISEVFKNPGMKAMTRFVFALVGLLGSGAAFGQSLPVGSTWVNDGGSEFTVDAVGPDGKITGTYVNKAAGFQCQEEPMAVIGWLDGDLVSFAVRWKNANKDCGSITSWTGYVAAGRLFTDWDLIYTSAETGLPTHLKQSNVFKPK
jgi:hypothetical protein